MTTDAATACRNPVYFECREYGMLGHIGATRPAEGEFQKPFGMDAKNRTPHTGEARDAKDGRHPEDRSLREAAHDASLLQFADSRGACSSVTNVSASSGIGQIPHLFVILVSDAKPYTPESESSESSQNVRNHPKTSGIISVQ